MTADDVGRIFDRANASFDRAGDSGAKVDSTLARAAAVMQRIGQRDGAVGAAAARERSRLNRSLAGLLVRVAVGIGVISLATIAIGLVIPIGLFGFLAAVGLAVGLAALLLVGGRDRTVAPPTVAPDLPSGAMVDRFDSYIFRARAALPAPAQAELDLLAGQLQPLRATLERVGDSDPAADDARRLMSNHLPGLIDRYLLVPAAFRGEADGEGVSVDQRLVEALAAGREALGDISKKLAARDVAAFETQGRFIQSRYGDSEVES